MAHTISFQYMEAGDSTPRAGYELDEREYEIPENGHVPRVGEFIQLVFLEKTATYQVLAVNTRIVVLGDQRPGWHTYLTVGPASEAPDERLTRIRE